MKKAVKIFNAMIDIFAPIIMLIVGVFHWITYNPERDIMGFGALIIALIIVGSIFLIPISKILSKLLKWITKKEKLSKIITAVINIVIGIFVFSIISDGELASLLILISIPILVAYIILLFLDEKSS